MNQSSGTTNHKKQRDFERGREYRQGDWQRQRLLEYEVSSKEPGTNRPDFGCYGRYADISGDTQSEVGEWLLLPFTFVLSCWTILMQHTCDYCTIMSFLILHFVLWEALSFILSSICFHICKQDLYVTQNNERQLVLRVWRTIHMHFKCTVT